MLFRVHRNDEGEEWTTVHWEGPIWGPTEIDLAASMIYLTFLPPPIWPWKRKQWEAEQVLKVLAYPPSRSNPDDLVKWKLRRTYRDWGAVRAEFARSDGWRFFTWIGWRTVGEVRIWRMLAMKVLLAFLYKIGWFDTGGNEQADTLAACVSYLWKYVRPKVPIWRSLPFPMDLKGFLRMYRGG